MTSDNRISTDGVYNYTYDDEGNLTKKVLLVNGNPTGATEEYVWDNRERLRQVIFKPSPTGTATRYIYYHYDHLNRIHRRLDDADGPGSGGSTIDFYIYDGMQIVQTFHKGLTGNAALTNRYLWGPEVDQLLSDEQVTSLSTVGTVYFALTDHLGSVRDLVTYDAGTDTTTVAKHRNYDSFGNVTTDSAPGVNELFSYTAKMFDTATGKQWNINRWYDPILATWMSPDPIGFAGGDENLRRYVGNHPTYATDPTGLETWDELIDQEIARVKELNARFGTHHSFFHQFTRRERREIEKELNLKGFDWDNGPFSQAQKSLQEREQTWGYSRNCLIFAGAVDALAGGFAIFGFNPQLWGRAAAVGGGAAGGATAKVLSTGGR